MEDLFGRLGISPDPPDGSAKLGISQSALDHGVPVHGLRHRPEAGTSGWYVWAGEGSDDPGFYLPMHHKHVAELLPDLTPYLGLPPGWRSLIAPGHEDVWWDESLVKS